MTRPPTITNITTYAPTSVPPTEPPIDRAVIVPSRGYGKTAMAAAIEHAQARGLDVTHWSRGDALAYGAQHVRTTADVCLSCGANPSISPATGAEPPIVKGALDAQGDAERRFFAERQRADDIGAQCAALRAELAEKVGVIRDVTAVLNRVTAERDALRRQTQGEAVVGGAGGTVTGGGATRTVTYAGRDVAQGPVSGAYMAAEIAAAEPQAAPEYLPGDLVLWGGRQYTMRSVGAGSSSVADVFGRCWSAFTRDLTRPPLAVGQWVRHAEHVTWRLECSEGTVDYRGEGLLIPVAPPAEGGGT